MIKEKKSLMFCFILILMSLFFINNLSGSCADNQRILRLYSEANSHAGFWNQSQYPIEICYNEIFGESYTGADPHTCTGDNKIIGLFSNFNSHVEIPSLNNYLTHVCYGNLSCIKDETSGNFCSDLNRKVVLRLYTETNSHASIFSYTNYPIKICCKAGTGFPPPPLEDVYWTNMMGELIADLGAEIGDTVLMRYKDQAGQSYDFEIKENDGLLPDDNIRTILGGDNFNFDTHLSAKWEITPEDYAQGWEIFENGALEFYFIVNSEDFNHDYDLTVEKDLRNNAFPNAIITSPPGMDGKYLINSQISFSQGSRDVDDDLKVIWDFNDGNSQEFLDCLTFNRASGCDTTHSYTSSGVKVIKLTAKEMTRIQSAEDSVRVLIYQPGINVFGMIDSPAVGEVIYGQWANINASSSFVAECSYGLCLNPNVVEGCYSVTNGTHTLECYDLPEPTSGGPYDIFMQWTFDYNHENEQIVKGYWSTNYNQIVEFAQWFRNPGYHTADLDIGYYLRSGGGPIPPID